MKGLSIEETGNEVVSPPKWQSIWNRSWGYGFAIFSSFFSNVFLAPVIDEQGDDNLRPFFLLIVPIAYLLVGYLWIALGSAVYNFLYKYIGGFEIEVKDEDR